MKVHVLSDLHVEFQDYQYQPCDADVVVLAGDIHTKNRGVTQAKQNIADIPVIYVLGNHEFYGKAYPKLIGEIKGLVKDTNIHVLENNYITIDGINFLGCTLWTNFELFGNPRIAGYQCQQVMTDYKKIRKSPQYSKLRSVDTSVIHTHSIKWLDETLTELQGQPNIVVSHHGPSIMSAPLYKQEDITTAAYVSDLDALILKHQPAYWIHGHLHNSSNYQLGNCTVLCNPKGYPGEENPDFDPIKSFTIKGY